MDNSLVDSCVIAILEARVARHDTISRAKSARNEARDRALRSEHEDLRSLKADHDLIIEEARCLMEVRRAVAAGPDNPDVEPAGQAEVESAMYAEYRAEVDRAKSSHTLAMKDVQSLRAYRLERARQDYEEAKAAAERRFRAELREAVAAAVNAAVEDVLRREEYAS